MGVSESLTRYPGPVVVCVRGPSRSGKTALVERLVGLLGAAGQQTVYLKRTHHLLDLPEKASGRVWAREPAGMVLRATDRLQITLPAGDGTAASLLRSCPPDTDIVLLETHTAEAYPTVLCDLLSPEAGEDVIGSWAAGTGFDSVAEKLAPVLLSLLPPDRELDLALRAAMQLHGGHACAGLVLGTRLALRGARELGVPVPDRSKRLLVASETDRCAVDAIQAVTGCRPGKRTLRILDYGKLAATFLDEWNGRAVRVATRGDLRARVGAPLDGADRHELQRQAYLTMVDEDLFTVSEADSEISQMDKPGPPRRRVNCIDCGEEVSDGRDLETDSGVRCRPCAAQIATPTTNTGRTA